MKATELIAELQAIVDEHGDLPVGIYHPVAKKWINPDKNEAVWFVKKDEHDLYLQGLRGEKFKIDTDFIAVTAC